MSNYTNDERKPFKKGKMSEVIKPKRRLFTRLTTKTSEDTTLVLKTDLVRIFADLGIVLQNTHTIARKLVKEGWVKTKKIERDI